MQYFAICDFVLSCKPFKVYIFEICNFRRTRWEYFHFKEKAKNPIWPPLIMLPQRPLCTKLWTSSFLFSSLLWSSVFIVYFSSKVIPKIFVNFSHLRETGSWVFYIEPIDPFRCKTSLNRRIFAVFCYLWLCFKL